MLLLGMLGCASPQLDTPDSPAQTATTPPAAAATPAADPAQAVRTFLGWYAARMDSPALYEEFVKHENGVDTLNYYVDSQATETWLTKLQATGMFSDAFLQGWRQHFREAAQELKRHPLNDGPPPGFDYDFFMLSQEPNLIATDLQAGSFQTVNTGAGRARVLARGRKHEEGHYAGLDFVLSRTPDQRWQIDSISNAGQVFEPAEP